MTVVVDVLPQMRSTAFDRALTYLVPAGMELRVGDVVRAPLGRRDVYGYVVSSPRGAEGSARTLRAVVQRVDVPAAFDDVALALARYVAERYCCSLAEALRTAVLAGVVPRTVDRLVPRARPQAGRFPSVPERLTRLIWSDLYEGFSLDALLRHPEARRAGDRKTLLRGVTALVRAGALERVRTYEPARLRDKTEGVLRATGTVVRGPRVAALVELVRAQGELRRADAVLAGFSRALIARAVRFGALAETERPLVPQERVIGNPPGLVPTGEQRRAIEALARATDARRFAEVLLAGVTASGKTFVYISAIARVLAGGGSAIVLVPEISLTPQTARRFEAAFGTRVAVLHSGLSERERLESWRAVARGERDVVVGARSAVFAPLADVRMIVVDEAHERTYKQDRAPRYHAAEVARERMRMAGGVLVLGSATPPLEAYEAALRGAVTHLRLVERATSLPLPAVRIVDMRSEFTRGNRRIFSSALVEGIERRLGRGEKVVLFVNRRGSAGFALCRECGFVPRCRRCDLSLTVHRAESLLRCHLCDAQERLPPVCPKCGGPLREFGVGTQKVAETVHGLFPRASVVRMDGDTTTRVGDHARLLDEFAERADVLVGTQMVAKGLDFPTVTLVGVVAADLGLHMPDFRADEWTFDLLTQVAGRSGRTRAGEAIVQTYSPEHPAVRFAAHHDYEGFARWALDERRAAGYPPYCALVYLGVVGRREPAVAAAAMRYADVLRAGGSWETLGPAPYPVARVNDEWRYRIALKTRDHVALRRFIRETVQPAARADRATRLVVNVDP